MLRNLVRRNVTMFSILLFLFFYIIIISYNPNFIYPWGYKPLNVGDKCIKGSQLRPDVVWFGEELDEELVASAIEKIHEAEYIIIIGTSLSVYPANKIPFYNNNDEVPIYIIDKEELKDLDDFIKTKNRIHIS